MKLSHIIPSFIAGVVLSVSFSFAIAQWSEPSEVPPRCSAGSPGCDVPIDNNGNGMRQAINGDLIVNNLIADNLIPIGVIKLNPSNTNLRAIACNSDTKGVIKYNDQTNKIQYCNGGGTWTDL